MQVTFKTFDETKDIETYSLSYTIYMLQCKPLLHHDCFVIEDCKVQKNCN